MYYLTFKFTVMDRPEREKSKKESEIVRRTRMQRMNTLWGYYWQKKGRHCLNKGSAALLKLQLSLKCPAELEPLTQALPRRPQ